MSRLILYIIENNLQDEDFTGEVLWYDQNDGCGIMQVGAENHEVYFDNSVLEGNFEPVSGMLLEFNYNTAIGSCACAKNVRQI